MKIHLITFLFSFLLFIPSFVSDGINNLILYPYSYKYMNAHVEAFKGAKEGLCKKDKDCYLLAKTIVYEARGEGLEGRRAVGFVVLNRMKHKRWPDTIEGVVKQPHQFSFWKDLHKQKKTTKEDWTKGFNTAYNVINGLVENPIELSNHYHSINVSPSWVKDMKFVVQLDNHKFYEY